MGSVYFINAAPIEPDFPTSPYLLRVASPQLGLLYLAAALESTGRRVEILDAASLALRPEEAAEKAALSDPRWIGIHANIASHHWALRIIGLLKEKGPERKVIVGGPAFIAAGEYLQAGADAVVAGEADELIVTLDHAIEEGAALSGIPGVTTAADFTNDIPRPAAPPENLDALPHPAWHLADPRLYQDPFAIQARPPMYYALASRGCFMDCAFCFQTYHDARFYRLRSVKGVMAELSELSSRFGIRHIKFQDDNFGGKVSWIEEFCEKISEELPGMTWHASMHAGSFRRDPKGRAAMLARSGCRSLHFGLQTTRSRQLEEIHRQEDEPEVLRRCLPLLREAGIYTVVDFIFGLPGESKETLREHGRYIMTMQAHAIQINPLNLVPHTELWKKYRDTIFSETSREDVDAAIKSTLRRYLLRPGVIYWNLKYIIGKNPRAFLTILRAAPLLLRLLLGRFRNPWIRREARTP